MNQRPNPALDWPGIVAELHRRGMTLTELARRSGLHSAVCRQVKDRTNYKGQKVIAEFLELKPEALWPDRYPKGKPRILDTTKYPPVASQNAQPGADKRAAA